MKKTLTWVTVDYFVDCDFNPELLKKILDLFKIHWIILLPYKNSRCSESDFKELNKLHDLKIEFLYSSFRQRDPRRLLYYLDLFKRIKEINADIIYLNCVPDPYLMPFFWIFNKRKTIFCAHDGEVHAGFDFNLITKATFKLSYKFAKYVCTFSYSQERLFNKNFSKSKTFVIPLSLKTFGNCNVLKSENKIIFLSFGVINYSKNIGLLIDAACNVYERGYNNFKISINGNCSNWDLYKSRIRYPQLFECNIRPINNNEIAEIFQKAHYLVQPYRHVSQSGVMKVAFNYNLPVIASDFPGFSEEIKEGTNGFLFHSLDVQSLEKLMSKVIDEHRTEYPLLLNKMAVHTKTFYAPNVIADRYLKMFDKVISSNVE
ncbi:MAG TPA: glycosyltransferase [Puia sp.]